MSRRKVSAGCGEPMAGLGANASKALALVALPNEFCKTIASDAKRLGYRSYVAEGVDVEALCVRVGPDVALVNVDALQGQEAIAVCRRRLGPSAKIAALTDIPCLLRAGECVRKGASVVLARPTTLMQILSALEGETRPELPPMSLDRAIWEYLNQTLAETGSIAAAARRLRLDRTSFKRMLRKRPPPW